MFDKRGNYDNIRALHMIRNIIIIPLAIFIYTSLSGTPYAFSLDESTATPGLKFPKYVATNQKAKTQEKTTPEKSKETAKPKAYSFDKKTEEIRILKKADTERIGTQSSYEEFTGLRFAKYFTVGQRVEIFQEAKSIDAYVLDAKHIRVLGQNGAIRKWDTAAHYRSQITPNFTRAYGTQITIDNPDDPSGQIAQLRYTLDYRDTYREFYPKWPHLLWHHWMQNEIMLIHGMQIPGINWYYTSNLGYRYSTIDQKDASPGTPSNSGYENRHTYILNFALAPSQYLEWFSQFEYFKSKRPRSTFPYSPDHWFFRNELRFRTRDLKTSIIPAFSYSVDYYFPFYNKFEKYESSIRVGHDFTDRLSATTQLKHVLSLRDETDNTAPSYAAPNPFTDSAAYIGWENRMSYNVWDKFYLQGGYDLNVGTNMSDFDNWSTFFGIEYYNPGMMRVNFGWNRYIYYNIEDTLDTVGFRVYVFM